MPTEMDGSGPLTGIRVIDCATERAELAGRVLADLGAEVIKVEPPGGAAARRLPPFDLGNPDGPTQPRRGLDRTVGSPSPTPSGRGLRPRDPRLRSEDLDNSLYWAAVALGKRSVVLDVNAGGDRERLLGLIAGADILIESYTPGTPAALGLDNECLHELNPRLIHVTVTPYGSTGPEALSPATDLTIEAAGGLLGLQGDGDRPPVPVGFPQASFHAGVQAAADAIIALNERRRSGRGQHLDVSMQAAMVWTLMHATGYPPNMGADPPRTGEHRADPPPEALPGVTLRSLWECADGYVQCSLGLGKLGGATLDGLLRTIEAEGALDPDLRGLTWQDWAADLQAGSMDAARVRAAIDTVAAFLRRNTKRDLLDLACREGLLLAPIYTVADMLADEQLRSRDYWEEHDGPTYPGRFARLSRTPVRLGERAPSLGEHQALVEGVTRPSSQKASAAHTPRHLAFEGLKVADFAWVGVGPITSKALADHGATVVHVETAARPDVLRLVPPYKDGVAGMDRSQFMANFNSSKLGLALNLADETGRRLARRLIDWADVVVESFTPGTMARWGLDYAAISPNRPELVMLSTCLRGQTGPQRTYGGFGGQGAALAGIHGVTGWPDRPPAGPWGAYTDFIAPRYAVAALAAAVDEQQRTGLGQHIDLSQVEAGIHFIEPLVLDYTVNGRVAPPAGLDSPRACPHGVYRTQGTERYVAVAVETAEQWRALRGVAPLDAFDDPALAELPARLAARDAIDAALASWAQDQDPWELAQRLKTAGVPASVVQRPSDLYKDAQLQHRGFFVTLEHSVMGPTPYDGLVTVFSATPAGPRTAAPAMGEHTHHVLTDLLGLNGEEIGEYAAAGVLS